MEWMILPLRRYAEFRGRSRRREYWMYFLLLVILYAIAGVIDYALGFGAANHVVVPNAVSVSWSDNNGPIEAILLLATLVPNLAVAVRRMHDIDRSGWWLLVVLIPLIGWIIVLVWYCTDGTRGANRYGADPKTDLSDLRETFR